MATVNPVPVRYILRGTSGRMHSSIPKAALSAAYIDMSGSGWVRADSSTPDIPAHDASQPEPSGTCDAFKCCAEYTKVDGTQVVYCGAADYVFRIPAVASDGSSYTAESLSMTVFGDKYLSEGCAVDVFVLDTIDPPSWSEIMGGAEGRVYSTDADNAEYGAPISASPRSDDGVGASTTVTAPLGIEVSSEKFIHVVVRLNDYRAVPVVEENGASRELVWVEGSALVLPASIALSTSSAVVLPSVGPDIRRLDPVVRDALDGVGSRIAVVEASVAGVAASVASKIDASALPQASDDLPSDDGEASAGSSAAYARADHVHPTDTTRLAVTDVVAPSSSSTAGKAADALATWGEISDASAFAAWYPNGNVTGKGQFTDGLKYEYDDFAGTAKVLAFTASAGDSVNGSASGTVVVPPYVERNGRRYTVVGVAGCGVSSTVQDSRLLNVVLPSTVVSIGDYAFYGCGGLKSIEFPGGLSSIGEHAFENSGLSGTLTLQNSITEIGVNCFAGCTSLKEVSIGDGLVKIAKRAFSGCTGLTDIFYGPTWGVNATGGVTGGKWGFDDNAFSGCTALKSVMIPCSASSAFVNCTGLEEVVYAVGPGDPVNGSFEGCTSLKKVSIMGPHSRYVGLDAFSGCDALELIDFSGFTYPGVMPKDPYKSGDFNFTSAPFKVVVPDAYYDAWKSAAGWSKLAESHEILRVSDWVRRTSDGAGVHDVDTIKARLRRNTKDQFYEDILYKLDSGSATADDVRFLLRVLYRAIGEIEMPTVDPDQWIVTEEYEPPEQSEP